MGAASLVLSLLVPGSATAVVIPKDLPTIEALIALHKCIKKDEDQALSIRRQRQMCIRDRGNSRW